MQIENASLAEFDWALANIDGKSKKQGKMGTEQWVYEVDAKASKEDVCFPYARRPLSNIFDF